MFENLVFKHNNTPCTSSRMVAQRFGKRHSDVIRAINNVEVSSNFRENNFMLTQICVDMPNGGTRTEHEYVMTKNGFVFLVMGFTGREAAKFKEAYIGAFDAMEAELTRQKGAALMYATAELIEQLDKAATVVGSYAKLSKRIGVSGATLSVLKNSLVNPRASHNFSEDMMRRIELHISRILKGPVGYETDLTDIILDISNKRARYKLMEYLKREAMI